MSWFRRRKRDIESAAEKLAVVDRKLVDQAARLVRLEAEIAPYTMYQQRQKGSP